MKNKKIIISITIIGALFLIGIIYFAYNSKNMVNNKLYEEKETSKTVIKKKVKSDSPKDDIETNQLKIVTPEVVKLRNMAGSNIVMHGIVNVNNKPCYIYPDLMHIPELNKTNKQLNNEKNKIIKGIMLEFLTKGNDEIILVTNGEKKTYDYIGEKILYYKVNNNKMYVSEDKNEWSRLYMSKVNLHPKERNIGLKVYLKCKYFKGEYAMYIYMND